jgi:hypothetical protein
MAQKRKCYAASCPTNVGESTTDFGFVPPERMTSAQLATAGEVTLLFCCSFYFFLLLSISVLRATCMGQLCPPCPIAHDMSF